MARPTLELSVAVRLGYGDGVSQKIRTSQVFVPGKLPVHTYIPRDEFYLEQSLNDYVEEGGAILTLAGPTKTGKTVLLRKVLEDPVWIDGQGLTSATDMWARVSDELSLYLVEELSDDASSSAATEGSLEGGMPFLRARAVTTNGGSTTTGSRVVAERLAATAARDARAASGRPLVIDDFHFIDRSTQRQIVRALKPLVLAGVPIVFVSISHRVREVVSAEPDMTGRVNTLLVQFWTDEDLIEIARRGFVKLRVVDPGDALARSLAKQAYGSPHLMQQFCRELCKYNGIREEADELVELNAPDDWKPFFEVQVEEASANWATRLIRGLKERGSTRTKYRTKNGLELDGYGLTLAAVAATGPKLGVSKDEIRAAIASMVVDSPPANNQTTSVLKNMSRIAALRLSEDLPSEEELEHTGADVDVQPVLDFMEDGPASSLHIADPFFAFYLAWGLNRQLEDVGRLKD